MEYPQLNLNTSMGVCKRVLKGFDDVIVAALPVGLESTLCVYK